MTLKEWLEEKGIDFLEVCIKTKNNVEITYGDPRVIYNCIGTKILRSHIIDEKIRERRHIAYLKTDTEMQFLLNPFEKNQSDWIPVSQPPKKDGEYIVVIVGATEATTLQYDCDEDIWFDECDYYRVKKWQPLPEA